MCVVYVERGRLLQANSCLLHAHQLAPHEDYILRHLQIIETRLSKLRAQKYSSKEKDLAFADFDPAEFGGNTNKPVIVVDEQINHVSEKTASSPEFIESRDSSDAQSQATDDQSHSGDSMAHKPNSQQQRNNVNSRNNYKIFATDLDDPSSGLS